MKAVFVLFGFLGFSHFAFFYNPKDKGFWEVTYLIANAVLQGSQVIFVSHNFLKMGTNFKKNF